VLSRRVAWGVLRIYFSFSLNVTEFFLTLAVLILGWVVAGQRSRLASAKARHSRELADYQTNRDLELAGQVARTAALFDRMVEGIIVVGPRGKVRLANRAASEFFGFNLPATDRSILETTRHHDVAALVARLEREEEILNHELRLDAVATTRYLQVNALALRSASGEWEGAIIVFHELTRLRQLEAVRQEFVANVSHELRTPLSLIKSAAETLIDGGRHDPAVTMRFLEIIDKHANRLTFLIDDLLLIARLDSGRVELNLAFVDLLSAAQDALDDAATIAASRKFSLHNAVPPGLVVPADPERLRQVLANLIDNAIKYGRAEGHVTVSGRSLPGNRVELSVRDDGPGIPPEARSRIFERFYRVDKARSREQGGTGLGLAIVKNVVQAHGGEVRVESAPDQGTEFFITLPAAETNAAR
jgi:two-component system phosphate regulon sensor histidine kinase PhoR